MLAFYLGPDCIRKLEYDEQQLIRIKKDFGGGNVQTSYDSSTPLAFEADRQRCNSAIRAN